MLKAGFFAWCPSLCYEGDILRRHVTCFSIGKELAMTYLAAKTLMLYIEVVMFLHSILGTQLSVSVLCIVCTNVNIEIGEQWRGAKSLICKWYRPNSMPWEAYLNNFHVL